MKDITKFLSKVALDRAVSPIRAITTYLLSLPPEKDVISLAGGMPAPKTFPFKNMNIELHNGQKIHVGGSDMAAALQYGKTCGSDSLLQFWEGMLEDLIQPYPSDDRKMMVTNGAEFGSYLALSALVNPGESILVASPIYSPNMLKAQSMNADLVSIPEDPVVGGLCPRQLRHILEGWPAGKPKPKLLMLCPTGSNPSGANIPEPSRQEIYNIACTHDLLILEDDPYYFINYGPKLRSFLSYDVEGRVIRFDSLSKVLCPGLRLGFTTAPSALVDVMEKHQSVSVLNTCPVSQAIALSYFQHVGVPGLVAHASSIADYYRSQRDAIISALDKHMSDLGTWIVPQAGMFVWVKLNGITDSSALATQAMDNGVCFVPGNAFVTTGTSPYIRLAFSLVEEGQVEEAILRLAQVIRAHLADV